MLRITVSFIVLSLFAVACGKPPKLERSGRGGADISVDDHRSEDKPIEGKPVEVKDSYLGLQCNVDDPKGFRAWRRLSNIELKNTISAVFGVKDVDVSSLPDDITRHGVYDTMMIPVNYVDAQRYRATRLIAKVVASKANIATLFPCLAEGAACMTKALPGLVSQAYRRPATEEETKKLTTLFTGLVADVGNTEAVKLLIQTIILSEPFQYRSELGVKAEGGVYNLTDWEMASTISYSITRGPPDETLRKLAESKSLTNEEVKKQVSRLFADSKTKESIKEFAAMWLDSRSMLQIDRPALPALTADVKQKSMAEVGDLFSDVLSRSTGSNLEALLTAEKIPAASGVLYDATPVNGQVQFKEADRRGILGQSSFLTTTSAVDYTSPVKRGAFVIERLLCTSFAPFPVLALPEKKPGETNRQRFLNLSKSEGCASCHLPMNEFGFAFENFDFNGKHRSMVEGEAIEVGSEVNIDGKKVKISSPAELSMAIAKSEQGRECYSRHVLRYSLGRQEYAPLPVIGAKAGDTVTVTAQGEADSCHIKAMTEAMMESGGDLKAPLIQLLTSESFRSRIDRRAEKTAEH